MHILIVIIVALFILFWGVKFLILNPKVNAVISIIALVSLVVLEPFSIEFTKFSTFLAVINLLDCVHDLILSDGFYDKPSDNIDVMFAWKSISVCVLGVLCYFSGEQAIVLALCPRVVFFCAVYPLLWLTVNNDIKDKILIGYPIPYFSWYYHRSPKRCYIYGKIVKKLYNNGKLVANFQTVKDEVEISQKKLDSQKPSNFVKKLVHNIFEDKENKEKRTDAENKISSKMIRRYSAYISSEFYENYSKKIANVLISKQATFSPWKIKELIELQDLNLMKPNGIFENVEWSEYFIIQCLKKMVEDGTINDFKCSDEPLNNHSYGISMVSRDASNNPALALDD